MDSKMKKSVVKPREYTYTEIKSLQTGTVVDLYGVVKFLKHPFKTRGKDHCMVVSLIDPTCDDDEKLKCLLFHSDPNKLPSLKIGDIVRFHRLKISTFNGENQGQSSPGFAWLVFSGQKDGPMDPKVSVSSNFTFSESDKHKIEDLRDWIERQNTKVIPVKTVKLENIIPQMYFDFVCQVVATCVFEEDNCLVLRVWDGTLTIYKLRKFEFEEKFVPQYDSELLKKADGFLVDVALYDDHYEKAKDKIMPGDFIKLINLHAAVYKTVDSAPCDIPTLELVLHRGNSYGRGFIFTEDKTLHDHLQSVGNLRTISNEDTSAQTKVLEKKNSRKDDYVIHDSQEPSTSNYKRHSTTNDERTAGKKQNLSSSNNNVTSTDEEQRSKVIEGYQDMEVDIPNKSQGVPSSGTRCMQQTVSVILGHPLVKVTNIIDVINGPTPYKYRILGNVEDFYPRTKIIQDFLKLYCQDCNYLSLVPKRGDNLVLPLQKHHVGVSYFFCPDCNRKALNYKDKNKSVLQYVYMMRLKILDDTGTLVVSMWNKEAVTFFRDMEPEDLLASESLWNELQDELDHLCSVDKPLIECCIYKYDVDGQTKYQIFDTCLV